MSWEWLKNTWNSFRMIGFSPEMAGRSHRPAISIKDIRASDHHHRTPDTGKITVKSALADPPTESSCFQSEHPAVAPPLCSGVTPTPASSRVSTLGQIVRVVVRRWWWPCSGVGVVEGVTLAEVPKPRFLDQSRTPMKMNVTGNRNSCNAL